MPKFSMLVHQNFEISESCFFLIGHHGMCSLWYSESNDTFSGGFQCAVGAAGSIDG